MFLSPSLPAKCSYLHIGKKRSAYLNLNSCICYIHLFFFHGWEYMCLGKREIEVTRECERGREIEDSRLVAVASECICWKCYAFAIWVRLVISELCQGLDTLSAIILRVHTFSRGNEMKKQKQQQQQQNLYSRCRTAKKNRIKAKVIHTDNYCTELPPNHYTVLPAPPKSILQRKKIFAKKRLPGFHLVIIFMRWKRKGEKEEIHPMYRRFHRPSS